MWPTGFDALRSPLKGVRPDGTVRTIQPITPGGGPLYQSIIREREEKRKKEEARKAEEQARENSGCIDEDFVEDDLDTPEGVQRELDKLWATPVKQMPKAAANSKENVAAGGERQRRAPATAPVGGRKKANGQQQHVRVNPEETKVGADVEFCCCVD